MVSFLVRQAEKALFENRVLLIPERERETDVLVPVANSADAVFAPAVGSRARMIVRKIIPRVAVRAVVFADRPPLALGEIWPPAFPMDFPLDAGLQPLFFLRSFADPARFEATRGTVAVRGERGKARSIRDQLQFCLRAGFTEALAAASGATAARFCILDGPAFKRRSPTLIRPTVETAPSASRQTPHRGASPRCSSLPRGDRRDLADVFSRQRFGPRFPVPSRILDGRRRPVARRNRLSAMGGVGKLGIRRAAIHILSAGVVDARRGARLGVALEDRAGTLHLARFDRGGMSMWKLAREWLRAQAAAAARIVRSEPVPSGDRLLPERFRRAFGGGAFASADMGGAARDRARGAMDGGLPLLAVIFAAIWLSNAPGASSRHTRWP